MPLLLNNQHDRKHADIYKDVTAFFDIGSVGAKQQRLGTALDALQPGDECVVVSPDHDGLFRFTRLSYTHPKGCFKTKMADPTACCLGRGSARRPF